MQNEMTIYNDNIDYDVSGIIESQTKTIAMFQPEHALDDDERYNALQNTDTQLSQMIGKPFNLVGFLVHAVKFTDKTTGELINAPRMVFIDSNGKTYVSVSSTLFGSLKNLVAAKGSPESWPKDGIKVALKQTQRAEKRYFSFEILK